MIYTKENIIGKTFIEKGKTPFVPLYICLEIKKDDVIMGYVNKTPQTSFSNNLQTTLKYFNDGTWHVFENEIEYNYF